MNLATKMLHTMHHEYQMQTAQRECEAAIAVRDRLRPAGGAEYVEALEACLEAKGAWLQTVRNYLKFVEAK